MQRLSDYILKRGGFQMKARTGRGPAGARGAHEREAQIRVRIARTPPAHALLAVFSAHGTQASHKATPGKLFALQNMFYTMWIGLPMGETPASRVVEEEHAEPARGRRPLRGFG
jgi:hypothetical protein